MKHFLFCLIMLPPLAFSQPQKNKIYYKSGIITQEMIQNYLADGQKIVQNKTLGIDVEVIIDTIFKKYTILFEDENGKNIAMVYNYVRDYFTDSKQENPQLNKIYKMEFGGVQFMLIDYLSTAHFYDLEIFYEEKLPNNTTLLHRVKNLKRVQYNLDQKNDY